MNVTEFLSTLAEKDTDITLIDRESEETIVELKAGGYASLQDDIEGRSIVKWKIKNSSSIDVYLAAPVDETTDAESGSGTDTSGD